MLIKLHFIKNLKLKLKQTKKEILNQNKNSSINQRIKKVEELLTKKNKNLSHYLC